MVSPVMTGISSPHNPTQLMMGFYHATKVLLMQNIKPTDLADQEHYICHCNKPFWYNCHELSSHLQFMNKMMSLFPGANNMPPFTQQDCKNIYFKMMPVEWQHECITSNGQDIASPNYLAKSATWEHRKHFVTVSHGGQGGGGGGGGGREWVIVVVGVGEWGSSILLVRKRMG